MFGVVTSFTVCLILLGIDVRFGKLDTASNVYNFALASFCEHWLWRPNREHAAPAARSSEWQHRAPVFRRRNSRRVPFLLCRLRLKANEPNFQGEGGFGSRRTTHGNVAYCRECVIHFPPRILALLLSSSVTFKLLEAPEAVKERVFLNQRHSLRAKKCTQFSCVVYSLTQFQALFPQRVFGMPPDTAPTSLSLPL